MKKLSIILICALVTFLSCTKSKENHPELGDGNEEFITIGAKKVHVKYTRNDIAELQKVMFHYSLAVVQQFHAVEMTKRQEYFDLTLNDLVSDTLYCYYFELYYKGGNTSTTERKTFHTLVMDTPDEPPTPPSGTPEGAVNGLFTINANGDQVYFSQGNLQYQASTNTWRFAERQWDYVGTHINVYAGNFGGTVDGSDNLEASADYNGWIDIYNWGTSGYSHGSSLYHPWGVGGSISNYNAYGGYHYNLYDQTGQADWGYNAISNGGNAENQWRTLKIEEWDYIMNMRTTVSDARFARANVDGVNGMILLPDDWNASLYVLNNINQTGEANYGENTISESDWSNILQYNGAVFLPAGGVREGTGTSLGGPGTAGWYWSSSCESSGYAYHAFFSVLMVTANTDHAVEMWHGHAVRLVQDTNP